MAEAETGWIGDMETVSERTHRNVHPKRDVASWGRAVSFCLVSLWAFAMMAIFPVYVKDRYRQMGLHKYRFFLYVSLLTLLPALAFAVLAKLWELGKSGRAAGAAERAKASGRRCWHGALRLGAVDWAVLAWIAAGLLSWANSPYRRSAWLGTEGWNMGLRTQLLMALSYFLVSRLGVARRVVLAGHFIGSGCAFLVGLLHRFSLDPLGLYEGLSQEIQLEFLSTIGQATWYSSYVCTVLAIGVALFWGAKGAVLRIAAGAYCALGFAVVVTQNSDSAFAAMAALFLGLFCISCAQPRWMERFFETLLLMLVSFKAVGVLRVLFPDYATPLGELSRFFSESAVSWGLLAVVSVMYFLFLLWRTKHWGKETLRCGKWLPWAVCGVAAAVVALTVVFIWLNTSGRLPRTIFHPYLYFDNLWGNYRGFSWKFAFFVIGEFTGLRFLTGIGLDSFAAYCYGNPLYAEKLDAFFGAEQTLTNVHNEFLNVFLCAGLLGFLAFVGIFVAAAARYGRYCRRDPLVAAGFLAALAYAAHNFFCYQQVCCTPFLFLLLGLAEHQVRKILAERRLPAV